MTEKIRAISMYRYRGGAAEKRLYGGQGTVTEFWIYFGDEKEPVKMMGHGPTPGQRKTDAIERAKALRNKPVLENAGRPQRKKRKPLPKWLAEQIREADQAVQEAEDELGEAENSGYQERIRDAEEAVETAYEDRDQLWDQAEKWEDTHAALLSNPTGGQVAAVAVGAAILAAAAWWLFKPKTAQAATPICFNNESGLRECYSPPLSDAAKTRLQQIYPNASPELKAAIDAALKQSPSTTYGVDPASMFMI